MAPPPEDAGDADAALDAALDGWRVSSAVAASSQPVAHNRPSKKIRRGTVPS
jgi:hypothetical protein